jgi:hypothetical protein
MMIIVLLRSLSVFQPADGGNVEVVGRLVEQQDLGVGKQRLDQQHAQLPARRDIAHRAVVLFAAGMPTPSSSSPARDSAV